MATYHHLNIDITSEIGTDDIRLRLAFPYEDLSLPYGYDVLGEDYNIFLHKVGKKEFRYEENDRFIIPATMTFEILDGNGKLYALLQQGKIINDALPSPFGDTTQKIKDILCSYYINETLQAEGYIYMREIIYEYKNNLLKIIIAPRIDRLKEITIQQIDPEENYIYDFLKIGEIISFFWDTTEPLVTPDIDIVHNWNFLAWWYDGEDVIQYNANSITDIYIDFRNFFKKEWSLYQALVELAKNFFSNIYIDESKIIFRQINLSPDTEYLVLEDDENIRNIKTESRYDYYHAAKIKYIGDGTNGILDDEFTVGRTDFPFIKTKEITIAYKFHDYEIHDNSFWGISNVRIKHPTLLYTYPSVYLVGYTFPYSAWGTYIGIHIYSYQNATINKPFFNLEILTKQFNLQKGYKHLLGYNSGTPVYDFYIPFSLSVDTLTEEGEVKCLKIIEGELLEDVPATGLYSSDGYVLLDSNGLYLFATQ